MSGSESAPSLLEQLRSKYGVDESLSLYGPSVVVPNRDLKREWSLALRQAGYRMYVGEHEGRVAWIIPLKPRQGSGAAIDNPFINDLSLNSQATYKASDGHEDPRSNGARLAMPTPQHSQDQAPSRGCITGRMWTQAEDSILLTMLNQGKGVNQIAKELAPKLNRSASAIETRLLKLRKKAPKPVGARPTPKKPESSPVQPKQEPASSPDLNRLKSLLSSCLALADNTQNLEAIRVLLAESLQTIREGLK